MAVLFTKARSAFLRGEIDWEDDAIIAVPVSAVPAADGPEFLADLAGIEIGPAGARAALSTFLTEAGGRAVADADNFTHESVASGSTYKGSLIVQDTGNAATSRVICFAARTEGDLLTNGEDITCTVAAGGFFRF